MINWISLKDRKPKVPGSKDDPIFKKALIAITYFQEKIDILHLFQWRFSEKNSLMYLSRFCGGETLQLSEELYHYWAEINLPEDKNDLP